MKLPLVTALLGLCLPLCVSAADPPRYRATLSGNSEVPSISTSATGRFHSYLASDGLHYELVYKDLEGGDVAQAHIHLGQQHTNGGVIVWLCSNMDSPPTPAGVPSCPDSPGRVIGVIGSMDVVGPAAQGLEPEDFRALLKALGNGTAYVNVHTASFPTGEIRGTTSRFVP